MSEQNPESLTNHDPYINKRFLALMGHEDNADITRALSVGLAINDAPAPSQAPQVEWREPSSRPPSVENLSELIAELMSDDLDDEDMHEDPTPQVRIWTADGRVVAPQPPKPQPLGIIGNDEEFLGGTDVYGDPIRFAWMDVDCVDHGREFGTVIRTGPSGFLLPAEQIPTLIAWLQARMDEGPHE